MYRSSRGFSLIEILIVIAIIGLGMAIGIPIYQGGVLERRADAVAMLAAEGRALEQFHEKNNVYTGITGLSAGTEFYTLSSTVTDQTFQLTAKRKSDTSIADDMCGDFTLTNTGVKGMDNAAAGLSPEFCWGR